MSHPVGPRRYRLSRQTDGSILAVDQVARGTTLVLTPRPVRDGVHILALSGSLTIQDGALAGVVAPARTHGYEIEEQRDGTIRFRKTLETQWALAISRLGTVPPTNFAVLALRDGSLLLVDRNGVHSLTIDPAPRSPFGPHYPGHPPPPPPGGGPYMDFAEDFAP